MKYMKHWDNTQNETKIPVYKIITLNFEGDMLASIFVLTSKCQYNTKLFKISCGKVFHIGNSLL